MRIADTSLQRCRTSPALRMLVGLALIALHTGCSVVKPIPDWDSDIDRFKLPAAPPAAAPAASPEASRFVGELGVVIDQVDERRRKLLGMAAEVVTGNSLYNFLLWPVTAGALYDIGKHSSSNPGLAAALGVAIYGMVSSGIPDRHKDYLRTARQLHCTLLDARADLYLNDDFRLTSGRQLGTDGNAAPSLPSVGTVGDVIDELGRQRTAYGRARLGLIQMLRPKGGEGPTRDALARRRDTALGQGGAAPTTDPRGEIESITAGYLDETKHTLELMQEFRGRVLLSGAALQSSANNQFDDLRGVLVEKAQPAQRPDVAIAQVGALMQAVAASAVEAAASAASAASAGKLKQQSADVRPGEYRIPTRLLDKLDADGRAVANSFDWIRGVELANAATAAGQWLAHDARQGAQARALAQSLGCAPVATTRSVPGGRSGTTKPLSP